MEIEAAELEAVELVAVELEMVVLRAALNHQLKIQIIQNLKNIKIALKRLLKILLKMKIS